MISVEVNGSDLIFDAEGIGVVVMVDIFSFRGGLLTARWCQGTNDGQ
jgi:hypothetical protein